MFYDGVTILGEKGGVPVVGVIPYVNHHIPEEDAVAIEAQNFVSSTEGEIDIVVIRLPRISNFDDFDPLGNESNVKIRYVDSPSEIGNPSAIILPGTKSTIADLVFLRERGLFDYIRTYADDGGCMVGICGGYQMLGELILDPEDIESTENNIQGLGLLPTTTIFEQIKATHQIKAKIKKSILWLDGIKDDTITGYEIHMGKTQLQRNQNWLAIESRSGKNVSVMDGAMSDDGKVWGCYIHGLFENHDFRRAWLKSLGWQPQAKVCVNLFSESVDELADAMEGSLDMEYLDSLLGQ